MCDYTTKNFLEGMNIYGKGFEYLRDKFPKLSDAKIKDCVFTEQQNRALIKDDLSVHLLTETEKSAWLMFKDVCLNFFGNVKTEKYTKHVEDLVNACQPMG
jgi:hypothetical protein